jgi:hypothetical protein
MGQIGRFLDRQRVHVGAEPDHLDLALAGLLALDDADDAGLAEAGGDLVAAEFAQAIATNAAVRWTSYSNSGFSWISRRQA